MAVPNTASRGDASEKNFITLDSAIWRSKQIADTYISTMQAGPILIQTIIDGIYVPFAAEAPAGLWHTIDDLAANSATMNYFYEQLRLRFVIDPDLWNLTTDRITLDGHKFAEDDPVRFEGPGTPPAVLDKSSNFFVFDVQGQGVSFKSTPLGAKLNIADAGSGAVFCEYRGIPDINTLTAAIEDVIDQIITDIPVTATTLEIRANKFDKALSSSTTGLEGVTRSTAETATLRTLLQAVSDAVEQAV